MIILSTETALRSQGCSWQPCLVGRLDVNKWFGRWTRTAAITNNHDPLKHQTRYHEKPAILLSAEKVAKIKELGC